jgi:hypothetical protein
MITKILSFFLNYFKSLINTIKDQELGTNLEPDPDPDPGGKLALLDIVKNTLSYRRQTVTVKV